MTNGIEIEGAGPENAGPAINQLLSQLQKRSQRLASLRDENQQLALQLAQREQELQLSRDQCNHLARQNADNLEKTSLQSEQQLQLREVEVKELHRRIEEFKSLSGDLAGKKETLNALSAEVAELQSRVRTAETKSDLLAKQLVETQSQLTRITETLGWRLLSKFGRIKYGVLLPAVRMFRQSRDAGPTPDAHNTKPDRP